MPWLVKSRFVCAGSRWTESNDSGEIHYFMIQTKHFRLTMFIVFPWDLELCFCWSQQRFLCYWMNKRDTCYWSVQMGWIHAIVLIRKGEWGDKPILQWPQRHLISLGISRLGHHVSNFNPGLVWTWWMSKPLVCSQIWSVFFTHIDWNLWLAQFEVSTELSPGVVWKFVPQPTDWRLLSSQITYSRTEQFKHYL